MMNSSTYDRKRAFEATSEPPSEHRGDDIDPLSAPPGKAFVIQQHYATALHHDVRLQMMNGETPVLVSWAVPKGLPRRRGDRHLAIRTEDHPMEYASFSGTIPEGEYGGGEVRIFDSGTYEMTARSDDRITFTLDGERLAGVWHLIDTDMKGGRDNWLALMSEDRRPPVEEMPTTQPMRPSPSTDVFDDPEWGFEPKWNGIRTMAVCSDETRLTSGDGKDITSDFSELNRIHDRLVALDALLDGVVVAFEDGLPSRQRIEERKHGSAETPVVYIVFDIIYLDGRDLTARTLGERRGILQEVIVPSERVQVSPMTPGDGTALLDAVSDQNLSGIVAKHLSSAYEPGAHTNEWLEIPTDH